MKAIKRIFVVVLVVLAVTLLIAIYLMRPATGMENYAKYYVNDTSALGDGRVRVTFFGVSTLLVDDGQTQILFDGFFSRPSLTRVLTSTISTDTAVVNDVIAKYNMNRVKGVFVTHSHYEHAMDAAYVAARTNAILFGSASTCKIGSGGGLRSEQMSVFQAGQEYRFGEFSVQVLASRHSPAASYNDDLGKTIDAPLVQPVKANAYVEGGSFDFLVKYMGHSIYIKPSANFMEGQLKGARADALFLGVGGLSNQDSTFQDTYYRQTVGMLHPAMVVPLHWDNFFRPLSGDMRMNPRLMDKTYRAFDFLIGRTMTDSVQFRLLQGGKSVVLFN